MKYSLLVTNAEYQNNLCVPLPIRHLFPQL